MRRIFQFDGNDGGLLSIGESNEYESIIVCLKDRNDNEVQMILSQDCFRDLCGLSGSINWRYSPETQERWKMLIQQHQAQSESEETTPF